MTDSFLRNASISLSIQIPYNSIGDTFQRSITVNGAKFIEEIDRKWNEEKSENERARHRYEHDAWLSNQTLRFINQVPHLLMAGMYKIVHLIEDQSLWFVWRKKRISREHENLYEMAENLYDFHWNIWTT